MSFARRITRLPRPHDPDAGAEARRRAGWASGDVARLIEGTAGSAPYLAGLLEVEDGWLQSALDRDPDSVVPELLADLPEGAADLGPALRRAKRRVALFAALADLGGVWELEAVTGALTALADRAVDAGMRALVAAELRRGKVPGQTEADAPTCAGMVALAMGKMGAAELNYSSDIDLILLFDEGRYAPEDYSEARAAFIRVARRLTAMLSDLTPEGYVFRTDLRLRPDASVMPVCLSMEAAEQYYESVGRTWERAAYIKARACGGDIAAGQGFLDRLRPFVWRRHLDFAAIQDAHDMRLRIRDHKGLHGDGLEGRDLKLGRGGIREIEFFTQTRQLIAGGRDPDLRCRDTVGGLAALAAKGWVPQEAAEVLTADYRAHRELEHRLQMVNDAQTHALPTTAEGFDRIAALMGTDSATLRADIRERVTRVAATAESFFAPKSGVAPAPEMSEAARESVARWNTYPALRSTRAVQIFDRLRPELLTRLMKTGRPDEALVQLDHFLRGLPAGVQIFSLLEANPVLVDLLVDIAATSPALAAYLGQNAEVFDAVIGGRFFQPLPDAAAFTGALEEVLAAAPDYEAGLNAARLWWKEQHFRIGVHHLRGQIGADAAGRAYAALADAVLTGLWPRLVADFATRHGPMPGRGAAVIGMGSLGAGWLTSGSDLDIIVIYDPDGAEMSEGRRPLAVRPYYARLTQGLVTALSAPMPGGRLYEVDMRLRPSGRQGPVATAIAAFRSYQKEEAWTWEHLALTRARPVAGVAEIGREVESFRQDVLAAPHDRAKVLADVAEMRDRIAAARGGAAFWDLKAGPGGVQDIELLGQTAALLAGSAARETPAQLAEAARTGFLDPAAVAALSRAHDLQQRLRTAMRLLADSPADPATLGAGAEALIIREAGAESIAEVEAMLEEVRGAAAEVIATALPPAAAAD
ncbi:glutamine-synthetase adenylyltransferase [Frigidibacter sp. ROC022]|uniref:[protein-PII] uridylyltransferase family protein n=1 Tax=Frigidibacter sp. ROC022 TaxID=2971796 RepID=UPI00215B4EB2|nr:glutamine-synthetase adenylyltransferase [Frigidibacter sp. ROC022]MCR8723783.1 glutamine-synthetase adenylyltransferase [Frigidibacter sp. ROC022]